MFCANCGTKVPDGSKFCPSCGAPIVMPAASATEAAPAPAPEAEPVVEKVAEPVVEKVAEPVAEAVAEPVAEAVAEPVVEAVAEPVAEAVAEPVVEAVAEPVAEVVAEPAVEAASAETAPVVETVAAAETAAAEAVVAETAPVAEAAPTPYAEPAPVVEPAPYAEPAPAPYAAGYAEPAPQPVPAPQPAPAPQSAPATEEKPKKKKKVWLIILIIVAALLLVGGCIIGVIAIVVVNVIKKAGNNLPNVINNNNPGYVVDVPVPGGNDTDLEYDVTVNDLTGKTFSGDIQLVGVSGADSLITYLEDVTGAPMSETDKTYFRNPDISAMPYCELYVYADQYSTGGWNFKLPYACGLQDPELRQFSDWDMLTQEQIQQGGYFDSVAIDPVNNNFYLHNQVPDQDNLYANNLFKNYTSYMTNGQFGIQFGGDIRKDKFNGGSYGIDGTFVLMFWYDTMDEPYVLTYTYQVDDVASAGGGSNYYTGSGDSGDYGSDFNYDDFFTEDGDIDFSNFDFDNYNFNY